MRISSVLLASIAIGCALPAHAIYINESRFTAMGGNLNNLAGTVPHVFDQLRMASHALQFHAVGDINGCTATLLGAEGNALWVLTAAHCVLNTQLSNRTNNLWFNDRNGNRIAGGWGGWVFVHPKWLSTAGGGPADIALLKLPRTNWSLSLPEQPIVYDRTSELGKPVTFLGNGIVGVGLQDVTHLWSGQRRAWGESVVDVIWGENDAIGAGYVPTGNTSSWARTDSGDSGSAYWQKHDGAWTIIATAASAGDTRQGGARVSSFASWIRDLFPGARLFSERMRLTESTSFTSINYASEAPHGSVYYVVAPGQAGVVGPTRGIWTGAFVPSWVTVPVRSGTGEAAMIKLRANRSTGPCGWVRMEDAVTCGSHSRTGQMQLAFHAADNPGLPSGAWQGKVSFDAVGWHAPAYRHRVDVDLDIVHGTRARVTRNVPFESVNYAVLAKRGTAYYLVPPQPGASGPTTAIWTGSSAHSTIIVKARSAVTQRIVDLRLRAQRSNGCYWRQMNDGVQCYIYREGPLKVWFDPRDNTALPAGVHRGVAHIQALAWHDPAVREAIRLEVDIDTMF